MKSIALVSRAAIAVAITSMFASVAHAQDAPPADNAQAASEQVSDDVIVTGTRVTGITAAESAAPIKLVGSEAIGHVGQPNLNQVLTQLVPSFTAQGFGGDTANLTLSASLRGLNPNETLVLVNGKRRHGTANLQVLSGAFQGGAAPDLDFITPASIDHIEVLEDGASAQYGSDAIAGVINVILKKKSGGELSATAGQYDKSDGETYAGSLNYGYANDRGFINVTGFYRFHNFSNRGKYDIRIFDPATGAPATISGSTALANAVKGTDGYPNLNFIVGDARSRFGVASYNAGYDITDGIQFYSFGSYGQRRAESYENYRLPSRVLGLNPATNAPYTYDQALASGNPNAIPRPAGFEPQEAIREIDYQFTGGLKGDIAGTTWDLSTSYGSDRDKIKTLHSINPLLFQLQNNDQADFYDGLYKATEWVSDLDLTHEFKDLGTLAGGAEYRRNKYTIGAGEPNSYYGTGAQSFPGFNPLAAGSHSRNNYAFYADFALTAVENLKADGAVRYEHYSDFGSKTTYKLTGRYDFSPMIAIRGTAATGFRAPTLAEEQYTAVNVAPTSATAQLAANSAAAKVLDIQNLKPEKSTNFSAGLVFRPQARLTVTVDAYQIKLKDRIVGSGSLQSTGMEGDRVAAAIAAAGVVLEGDLPQFVSAFVNGPNTRTRGVDVVASYDADFASYGRATFTLSAAYNKTIITREGQGTAYVPAAELFNPQTYSFLTTSLPRLKVIGGINWNVAAFSITARETYYSKSVALLYNDNDPLADSSYAYSKVKPAAISDLEVGYHITPALTIAGGANNVFDKKPEKVRFDADGVLSGDSLVGGAPYQFGPYGINGGYYYGRVTFNF